MASYIFGTIVIEYLLYFRCCPRARNTATGNEQKCLHTVSYVLLDETDNPERLSTRYRTLNSENH